MDLNIFREKRKLNLPWLIKMAWRDSRRSRSRLFLFISSIVLGIAVLVAIYSLSYNVRKDIDEQAKTLIGADLSIESNRLPKPEIEKMLDSLGAKRSKERTFASMIFFIRSQGTRLVQIRALEGLYPYYGAIETSPAAASRSFRNKQQALVDKTLMLQFDAKVGDSIKVGELSFAIAGVLNKAPGRTGISTTVAPAVYIPLSYLEQTGLLQKGSRVSYNYYYQFAPDTNIDNLIKEIEPRLEKNGLDYDTVESRKQNTGRSFEDFTEFLTLIGFIALLLGCIGVASAIHIYIKEKLPSIAILRCLGVTSFQAFLIYLIQIIGIGLIGSLIGSLLGTLIQQLLPAVLKDFLPVEISAAISWVAILQGLSVGVMISVLFALLPLISIRKISPLFTLRLSLEGAQTRDRLKWIVYGLIVCFIFGFTYIQMHQVMRAVVFTVSVLGAFGILAVMARLLMWMVRRFFPSSWSYLWRQGFANLFRPNNQTLILIVAIGLGTSFICTMYFVQDILVNRITLSASGNQPNMVLFDIQTAQKEKIAALTKQNQLPVIQEVPIVTMRIEEINGITALKVRQDTSLRIPPWAFEGELRVTYRDSLTDSEKIADGEWHPETVTGNNPVYISMEDGYARRIRVKIGDTIVFNVQGALVTTIIGSFRTVDWNRVQTNFRVVFPRGVLEDAPQFHVLITRVPSTEASAKFQREVVKAYPNVSIIDLGLILSVMDDILEKIGFVIRFMGGFSIVTGLVVLIASVLISKYQRIQESVLLRTLGASRKQILAITALEYFFLGALASATGILLALAAGWALAKYSFKSVFRPDPLPIVIIFFAVSLLTVVIGLFNSRSILSKPPLEILRSEV
jgi:putative ABC transport system permease protein